MWLMILWLAKDFCLCSSVLFYVFEWNTVFLKRNLGIVVEFIKRNDFTMMKGRRVYKKLCRKMKDFSLWHRNTTKRRELFSWQNSFLKIKSKRFGWKPILLIWSANMSSWKSRDAIILVYAHFMVKIPLPFPFRRKNKFITASVAIGAGMFFPL